MYIPEFIKDATNVYRTKKYIVKQRVGLKTCLTEDNVVYSYDTFYLRTKKRDSEYSLWFIQKNNPNGKRLPCSMYSRRYVE